MPDILTNLKIIGITQPDGAPVPTGGSFFEVMFNPATYTINNKINFDTQQAEGSEASDPKFKNIAPEAFSLEFVLDGTGVAKEKKSVTEQVANFKTVTMGLNGTIHRPNYLIIQWGVFIRDCVMETANITYSLFSKEGIPLRAKITASFIARKESTLNAAASMLSSPDLTHRITVDAKNDILANIVYKTYRNPKYYLQVARANKLTNFRKLVTGTELILPPIK